MVNPLLYFAARQSTRNPEHSARRRTVEVPQGHDIDIPIFLVLRRLRAPIVLILVAFTVAVFGLSVMPPPEGEQPLTIFDAFYVISYTATTIGFGEIPYAFSVAQRMWTAFSIYLTVVTWAYALGAVFSLIRDDAFQQSVAAYRLRSKVRRLGEPFVIVCGYGQAGRRVGLGLDEAGYLFVAVDRDSDKIEDYRVASQLHQDAPGITGDARLPGVLGRAGLGHPQCQGLLALTGDDTTNLAIVMAGNLLRPEIPVIARCQDEQLEERMHEFGVDEVINPFDRYGAYLLLGMQRPVVHRLTTWLLSPTGEPLPEQEEDPRQDGRWLVIGDDDFADELVADLESGGLQVSLMGADADLAEHGDVVGLVAGTPDDTMNIALAEQARQDHAALFVAVRQSSSQLKLLTDALELDSVFVPPDLVARETLARVVTPYFRSFVDELLAQDDAWAQDVLDRLVRHCGEHNPPRDLVALDQDLAPAAWSWLRRGHDLTLGDLLRHPEDRDEHLDAVVLLLIRPGGERVAMPAGDTCLADGDRLLIAGSEEARGLLLESLHHDSALTYVATGTAVPATWLFRVLTRSRRRDVLS